MRVEVLGTGNQTDATAIGTVVAVGYAPPCEGVYGDFAILVQHAGGRLSDHFAEHATILSEPPTLLGRIVPEWARPHIAEAIGGGLLLAAFVLGFSVLAAVL